MELVRRLELAQDPQSVGEARAFVTQCCLDWDLPDPDAVTPLVVSELVTNALQHARGPITLFVGRRLDHLVISVQDGGDTPLEPYPHDPLAESGRGLDLVASLAASWGAQDLEHGKRVWAELPSPPTPSGR